MTNLQKIYLVTTLETIRDNNTCFDAVATKIGYKGTEALLKLLRQLKEDIGEGEKA